MKPRGGGEQRGSPGSPPAAVVCPGDPHDGELYEGPLWWGSTRGLLLQDAVGAVLEQ